MERSLRDLKTEALDVVLLHLWSRVYAALKKHFWYRNFWLDWGTPGARADDTGMRHLKETWQSV